MAKKKDKLPLVAPEKKDAFSQIAKFMVDEGVVLTSDEEKILDRWLYCDALMRQKVLSHDQIIGKLKEKYSISEFTAISDIRNTQKLFERARQISRKYLLNLHIERIDKDIELARQRLFNIEVEPGVTAERTPDGKELMALARLHHAYTDAVVALPEDPAKDKLPPPVFIFNLPEGQSIAKPMDPADAMAAADKIINMTEKDGIFKADDEQ